MSSRGAIDAQNLARHVRQRRGKLSQLDIAERGGPSTTTQSVIESGELVSAPQTSTLAKLDRALGWAPGSAEAVLYGGIPTELPGWPDVEPVIRADPRVARWTPTAEADVKAMNLDELAEYWAAVDFEASRAGREYARRRHIGFAEAREELYRYLRDGGLPSDEHPEADRPPGSEAGSGQQTGKVDKAWALLQAKMGASPDAPDLTRDQLQRGVAEAILMSELSDSVTLGELRTTAAAIASDQPSRASAADAPSAAAYRRAFPEPTGGPAEAGDAESAAFGLAARRGRIEEREPGE